MSLQDDGKLIDYARRSDSQFAIITNIANMAREKCESWGGFLLESEALTWVMQNKHPDIVEDVGDTSNLPKKMQYKSKLDFINDFISSIDDQDIQEAVKASYILSLRRKNLVYEYQSITNKSKQAKVRVLAKMLWNKGMK